MRNVRLTLLALVTFVFVMLSIVSAHAAEQFSNFALSTLTNSIGSGDTSLTLASTQNFPGTAPFRLTIQDSAVATPEIVYVTAVSGSTYTITRGYEGTTATAHSAGAQVAQFVTAGVISGFSNSIATSLQSPNNLSDIASASSARTNLGLGSAAVQAGTTGAIVGTTDTQTLTNKTLGQTAITGALNSSLSQTTLNGTTTGSLVYSLPFQGASYKEFVGYFSGYSNNTGTNQTVTFPVSFTNPPLIVGNSSGLTITATATTLTIVSPHTTATYGGTLILGGF